MKESESSDKLFGNLALALLVAGMLVPHVIVVLAGENIAITFSVVALALALIFGVLGWKRKTGKVTVIAVACLAVISLVTFLLYSRTRKKSMEEMVNRERQHIERSAEQADER